MENKKEKCNDCKKEYDKDTMHYVKVKPYPSTEKAWICKECGHKRANRVNAI